MLLPLFTLISTPAIADLPTGPASQYHTDDCASLHQIARSTMDARQSGVAMADMMDSAERHMKGNWQRMAQQLIQDAYSQPRYSTSAKQQAAISTFAGSIHEACMER
tara:strand:- start:9616 stop:9936 length:321 start_codon:yes stop_codon:yes gene_type:complete